MTASPPNLLVYGKPDCVDCERSRALLDALAVPYDFINIRSDESAATLAREISGGVLSPVIVFPDGSHVVEPSNEDLAAKLGQGVPEGHTSAEVCEV
ncbi:MAG: glutaredoxin family protein [Rhodoglobus sp.]|nr:glutaredoxin family protein [Rhodoglobus sp.]